MIPVLTVAEMKAVDAAAQEPVEVLIERAGGAVARAAVQMLGGTYGRRVVVVAGKGSNGADGRVAARRLQRRGVAVTVIDAESGRDHLPASDLVIDAAYGTGLRGPYRAPSVGSTPVLAVDIPSGVDGDTGVAADSAVTASATVTFAALKPGLLFGDGPERAGPVEVADIGLDVSGATAHVVEPADVVLPERGHRAHKWQAGVCVVAGSPGMLGAASLAARAALRAGASIVRLAIPGVSAADLPIGEAIAVALPAEGWESSVLDDLERFKVLVIGPGLGRGEAVQTAVRKVIAQSPVPVVADADALVAVADSGLNRSDVVLTPHDGEFARIRGAKVGPDRLAEVRRAAAELGVVMLLKGSTTTIAGPTGEALISAGGTSRLATAGTGDVLSGVIGAFAAAGLPLLHAASFAAVAHAGAASLGPRRGMIAGDVIDLLPRWLSERPRPSGGERD